MGELSFGIVETNTAPEIKQIHLLWHKWQINSIIMTKFNNIHWAFNIFILITL